MSELRIPYSAIEAAAAHRGLSLLAVITDSPDLSAHRKRLRRWQEMGYAGDMRYMRRDPVLLTEPRRLLAELRSILCFAVPYRAAGERHPPLPCGHGRVARYAWGEDYHLVLRRLLGGFVAELEAQWGPIRHRIFSDAVPLVERALASVGGLGFIGKNTLLFHARAGSYVFLAELLWEVIVTGGPRPALRVVDHFTSPSDDRSRPACGSCQRCLERCPTGALRNAGELDARRCISYLTIEKQGVLKSDERAMIGDWLFGCDVCQECCPYNATRGGNAGRSASEVLLEFSAVAGVGSSVALLDLLKDGRDLRRRIAHTPLSRAGRTGLVRNACAVAANTRFELAVPELEKLAKGDRSEVVRAQAEEALRCFGEGA